MNSPDWLYWLALKKVDGVGPVSFRALLNAFGSPRQVFAASMEQILAVPCITYKIAANIKRFQFWERAEKEAALLANSDVKLVTFLDESYPRLLLNIYDAPPFLFVRGRLLPDEVCLAIVGSRVASEYGRHITHTLAQGLAQRGITIVSGLARGIDAAAHQGALAGRGRTIAVLGCGIDVIYPLENKALFQKIPEHGAIVSEHFFGTPPNKENFPLRNRIISGTSIGVLVTEATNKSGSLITAGLAVEQGREVFAVPGPIDAKGSRGAHLLLKNGAKLVEDVDDIIEEIAPQIGQVTKVPWELSAAQRLPQEESSQQKSGASAPVAPPEQLAVPCNSITKKEKMKKENEPNGVFGLLLPELCRAVSEAGYTNPTPIQEQSIPLLLNGRDMLGCAQTGTGKTAAFTLPILQHLLLGKKSPVQGKPLVLILAPTRELAAQIGESVAKYGKHTKIKHTVIFGGVGQNPQVRASQRGVHVLVATPGRLLDLMNQKYVDLSGVEIFVLDEADRMLDMGFIHDINKVIAKLPKKRQSLFYSATMEHAVVELASKLVSNPAHVTVTPKTPAVERIVQKVMFVDKKHKNELLINLMDSKKLHRVLIFTQMKHIANKVAANLGEAGITSTAIHGNKSQAARTSALADFKAGRVRALVATDIAARGIDVEGISHVINYDMPVEPETYVHRIGRTARAGADGNAISLCSASERDCLRAIERFIRTTIPVDLKHDLFCEQAMNATGADAQPKPKLRQPSGRLTVGDYDSTKQRKVGKIFGVRAAVQRMPQKAVKMESFQASLPLSEDAAVPAAALPLRAMRLNEPYAERLLATITKGKIALDDIVKETKIPVKDALGALALLEIRGLVKQLPGKFFIVEE